MTPILRHLFTPIFAVALLANAGGGAVAAGGEGESSRAIDRDDVGKLAGQYILLDPLWVSIRDEARNRTYQGGILVRLEPEPARKVDACYAVPDIVDALVIDFYENRLTRSEHHRPGYVAKRVQDVVERVAGKDVFKVPEVYQQVPEMDDNSIKLSRICQ